MTARSAIVGAGPAGLTAAIARRELGRRCTDDARHGATAGVRFAGGDETDYGTKSRDGPTSEIVACLVDDRERATELRQSTPFAGALDPRERWRIWREIGDRARAGT